MHFSKHGRFIRVLAIFLLSVLFTQAVYAAPVFAASKYTEVYGKNLKGNYSSSGFPFSRWKKPSEFKTNAMYANFRSLSGGTMGKNVLFRSRIPDDTADCSRIADYMMQDAGVKYIINLYETAATLKNKFRDPAYKDLYYRKVYRNGRVAACRTLMHFSTKNERESNRRAMVSGFRVIAAHGGPYLVHCAAGKDRTGLFCVIAEALMGATYTQILNDYMQTYLNYGYKSSRAGALAFCKKNLDYMLQLVTYCPSGSKWSKMKLAEKAERYLRDGGLTAGQIRSIKKHLKKSYSIATRTQNGNYYFTVKIKDGVTGYVIFSQKVAYGKNAVLPEPPEHDGYTFEGWDSNGTAIKSDQVITAGFRKDNEGSVESLPEEAPK